MLLIDPTELTGIQAEVLGILPDTCTVTRPSNQTSDGAGGFTETYTSHATGVPCNSFPARSLSSLAQDIQQNDQSRVVGEWIIQVPYNTDVQLRDRIITNGVTYEVIENDSKSTWNTIQSVKATLIE